MNFEGRGISDTRFSIVLVVLTLAFSAIGLGLISVASSQQNTIRADQTQIQALRSNPGTANSSVYTLTLLIANNQEFNSTVGQMPRYYVLGPSGLESSANISVPANTLIKLVIVNYDDGSNIMSSQLAAVTGTVGNSAMVFNGTSNEGATVKSLPTDGAISHTFTVSSLGVNVPVQASSTTVAYLRFDRAGTYTWNCFSPCMPWSIMTTAKGWMTGTFTVT